MIDADKPFIENLFQELRELGVVSSTDDFSRDWLGMNKSYLRCIRARNRQPTVRVLSQCATRLRNASEHLAATDATTQSRKVARRFRQLAEQCKQAVFP